MRLFEISFVWVSLIYFGGRDMGTGVKYLGLLTILKINLFFPTIFLPLTFIYLQGYIFSIKIIFIPPSPLISNHIFPPLKLWYEGYNVLNIGGIYGFIEVTMTYKLYFSPKITKLYIYPPGGGKGVGHNYLNLFPLPHI